MDEQVYKVPKCPICDEHPAFWIIGSSQITRNLWLFSDEYLNKSKEDGHLVGYKRFVKCSFETYVSEDVLWVRCRPFNKGNYADCHMFREGHEVFHEVIEEIERAIVDGNYYIDV